MNLEHDDIGAGDPPLLFIHGWTCDRSYFAPQADHFASSHRVVSIDQRGHGKTAPAADGDYSIPAFAADAAELIQSIALDRPVVVGHSLGGAISLQLAASQPELVRGAVLVDPAPIVMDADTQALFEAIVGGLPTREGREALIEMMFLPTDDVDRKAQIKRSMLAARDDVAVAAFDGIGAWDGAEALKACAVPLALIGAAGPYNDAAVLRQINPDIVIAQTLGAGHFNQLEVPDQVNAMIEQFLRLLERA